MNTGICIIGLLQTDVVDNHNKLARDAGRQIRRIVKAAGGSSIRFEVRNGQIFVTFKDEKGLTELKTELSVVPDVKVQEVTPLMLVYLKSAASAQQKAA